MKLTVDIISANNNIFDSLNLSVVREMANSITLISYAEKSFAIDVKSV